MDWHIVILRFALTFILSIVYGIDRQRSHKPIGFGTFIFVATGASALGITAMTLSPENPLPLLSAIVSGIGFLGAGALMKTTDKIFGFTSAASIWFFAILGLVIGVGEYFIAFTLYALLWVVILYDKHLEKRGMGSYQRKMVITTNKISEKELKEIIIQNSHKSKLICLDVDKKNSMLVFTYQIEGTKDEINRIPKALYAKDWFLSCRVE